MTADPLLPVPPVAAAEPILAPGRNCWRVERADRLAVIVDAEDYFLHAKTALRRARRSVYLTAWDFDARIRLTPQSHRVQRPDRLGRLLNWLATTRPDLRIHVLKWDYAEFFDLARWSRPFLLRNGLTHRRLQYRLDGDHPTGACHHQKLLVIDDSLAFCGGLDLTANRWDTRAHLGQDRRRRQPDGTPYDPFHDVMMAVDGDAARALGELFRGRWLRATGESLEPPALPILVPPPRRFAHRRFLRRVSPEARPEARVAADPWPPALVPLARGVRVGISRTDPGGNGRPEAREVEALFLDAIARARRVIYLESQYFASTAVARALAARLAEADGPEVVVVNPVRSPSWLENTAMLGARANRLRELRAADRHGRFAVYCPRADDGTPITVHSKVMVVDDRLLRIGSANLNNRSMGLDSECDLAWEANPEDPAEAEHCRAIAHSRDDLIAEHLGVVPERVALETRRRGSLIAAIEALRRPEGRRLEPLTEDALEGLSLVVADSGLLDPERPVGAVELLRGVLPSRVPRRHRWLLVALGLLALLLALTPDHAEGVETTDPTMVGLAWLWHAAILSLHRAEGWAWGLLVDYGVWLAAALALVWLARAATRRAGMNRGSDPP